MKLTTVIDLLQEDLDDPGSVSIDELVEAEEIAIEAMKRLMIVREIHTAYWAPLLPGETKESAP